MLNLKCVFFTEDTFADFVRAKGELMAKTGKNLTHDDFLKYLLEKVKEG